MYALHDAMVKPMPGQPQGAEPEPSPGRCRATGWSYEFVLRKGARFHNGEPVTAEDVKFSFDRYRGTSARALKDQVAAVEVVDPQRVRFRLKRPWPDFLTFYSSATGAGWIVPKKYVEQVGDDGFKKAPIGAGPYRFVSFTPGVELVFEAFEQYWRKTPSVKRLVFRVIPDETTRLAALKRGEVDIVYSIRGELAEELKRSPGLVAEGRGAPGHVLALLRRPVGRQVALARPARAAGGQPGHQPPGHQRGAHAGLLQDHRQHHPDELRVLLAAARARPSIRPPPRSSWPTPAIPTASTPASTSATRTYANLGEAVINDLQAVGIRATLRPLERAAFFSGYGEKKFKNLIQGSSGAFGNAATRLEAFVATGGAYVYGTYPDIDGLFQEQAVDSDRKRREATLHADPADRPRAGRVRADLAAGLHQRRGAAGAGSRGSGSSAATPTPRPTRT